MIGWLLAGALDLPPPALLGAHQAENAGIAIAAARALDWVFPDTAEGIHAALAAGASLLWANTVLAAGRAIGMVVYTGRETRTVMNTSHPQTKVGLLDLEINRLSKILCAVTLTLSVLLVALNGFRGKWYIYVMRFLILFSSIIPISLRVNLDMGKTVYARQIMGDRDIPHTIVRTSTLPEELGRIEYLLSDKTGTLTQNEMELKRLHLGTMSYGWDSMDEVRRQLHDAMRRDVRRTRTWRDMSAKVYDMVMALALCHNVTPVTNEDGSVTYQASSPDEVALVDWTRSMGVHLAARDQHSITLSGDLGTFVYDILEVFPFTSERKRMGIVVRDRASGDIFFYMKGADVVMSMWAFGMGGRAPFDELREILGATGLDARGAKTAARTLLHFVYGHAYDEQSHAQAARSGIASDARPESDFDTGLDIILTGVESLVVR